ncbi:PE family protein [Mycobacterium asiaticum]|uniref:PE domain-containing protein n=1 Tax=Mycobacterium asiaticum TaxID=1790 RepID=A0A1A3CFX9_MYCAS|nr:PE family protein [Mycobacterium asiaticum]OBI85287.1 hypothetical protein A9X01_18105 [Mycobacterium asiaticum]
MSFLNTVPELVSAAAADLAGIGSSIGAAGDSIAAATTALLPAGADEISAAVAGLFGSHGQEYQRLSAQITRFHEQFVQSIRAGVNAYAGAEAINLTSLQGLASAATASPFQQLEQMQINFNTNLVANELAFNQKLVASEVAFERQLFGTESAFNGALNRSFNVGNLLLGTGEQAVNLFFGAPVPSNFISSLLLGTGQQTFNGGQIGGLVGAFDQALMVPTDLIGLIAGDTGPTAAAGLSALGVAAPLTPFQQLEQMQIAFNTNLVANQLAFNQSLLANEVAFERQLFGTDSAFNGALNRSFNAANLLLGSGQQAVDLFFGAPVPANFISSLLLGSGQQVFNGGQIGGLVGAFDQALMVPTDLIGLIAGDTGPTAAAGLSALGVAAPLTPFQQLEQMQIAFNTNLVANQLAFNQSLLANEVAFERQLFGTDSAFNGALNRSFNAANLLLGSGQQAVDLFFGAPVPANFTSSLLLGSGQQVFNGGQIGGLVGAFDQALMVPTNLIGLLAGDTGPTAAAGLSALGVAAPLTPFQQLEQMQIAFNTNLVSNQLAFNQALVANEVRWEQQVFGTDSALNGTLNRSFNTVNLLLGTGQQAVDLFFGAPVPPNFTSSLLLGTGQQTFNGGQIGGLVGAFDQALMAGADFVGLFTEPFTG